ncbi:MAG: TolC family protein [Desulfobacula sp.]|nr:TolC family protein [Desulfobacula sp.]
MKLKIIHICIIIACAISTLWASVSFSLELTLPEAVKLALENNPEIRLNRLELEIKQSEINKKLAEYIPALNLDSSYTYWEDDPDVSELETKNQHYQAGISQKVPLGGLLSLSVNYGRSDYSPFYTEVTNYRLGPGFSIESFPDTMGVASRDDHYTGINLFYSHHLLKDGIVGPAFAPVKESRFNRDIQKDFFIQSRINLIQRVEITFFETALRQKEIKVYQEILDINKQLLKNLKSKQRLGMIPEIDVMSAQIKVYEAKEKLFSSQASFQTSTQGLKMLLNTKEHIKVISGFKTNEPLRQLDDLIIFAMNKNKDLTQLKANLKKEKLLLAVAKNQYLPQVDLYVSINKKGQGSSIDKAKNLEETEYNAGIIFIYPLYPLDPKENYLQAKLKFRQAKVQLRQAELSITNQITTLYRQIQLVEKKIKVQTRQIKILKERMEISLKAFKERLIDLKIVYDIQDDLISGEQKYLYYLFEYQSLNSSLTALTR